MIFSKWDECELAHYEKFAKTDEGLAYTIAMEMYHARKVCEQRQKEKDLIVKAMKNIAEGFAMLERVTGFDMHKYLKKGFMTDAEAKLNIKESEVK